MIVDASVAVPWFVDTPFSVSARRLRSFQGSAPALLLVETTNSLLKYVRLGQIDLDQVLVGMGALNVAITEFVPDAALLPSATKLAAGNNYKIYDCLYLALALERNEPLATADKRLAVLANSLSIPTELIEPAS